MYWCTTAHWHIINYTGILLQTQHAWFLTCEAVPCRIAPSWQALFWPITSTCVMSQVVISSHTVCGTVWTIVVSIAHHLKLKGDGSLSMLTSVCCSSSECAANSESSHLNKHFVNQIIGSQCIIVRHFNIELKWSLLTRRESQQLHIRVLLLQLLLLVVIVVVTTCCRGNYYKNSTIELY